MQATRRFQDVLTPQPQPSGIDVLCLFTAAAGLSGGNLGV